MPQLKVVFDTNVFISAFILPGSQGEEAFLRARRKEVELYSSVPILTETAQILRTKFYQSEEDIKSALRLIGRAARIIRPTERLSVLDDLADNRILECAVAAHSDLIVTGDRHLLALKQFSEIRIVRLADFLHLFPHSDT